MQKKASGPAMFSVRPVPDREGTSTAIDPKDPVYLRCHIDPDNLLKKNVPGDSLLPVAYLPRNV